ncbi:MAG TPA: hypothetical protein VFR90_06120 [Methylibium sp.]|uniref:hypothetical protein n=1 Tax=Methylibium sp. TaxID=2067992 RepID=UPI002DBCFA61|nr:hypothetical protein [Methylibium sp.]HEU4458681.1 hypothetical protein [Methylibium sp.]
MKRRICHLLIAFMVLAAIAAAAFYFDKISGAVTGSKSTVEARKTEASFPRNASEVVIENKSSKLAVTKSQGRHSDFSGELIDLDGLTVGEYIAKRWNLAKNGSATDQYEIYRATTICARIAEQKNALLMLPPGSSSKSLLDSLKSNIENAELVCADVTEIQKTKERLEFLRSSAQGGNADAQVAFFAEGPSGAPIDFSEQPQNDFNLEAWKKEALGYLNSAAESRHRLALSILSQIYEEGSIARKDYRRALTYAVAEAKVRNLDPATQTVVNSLVKKMTSEEVAVSIEEGTKLAEGK